MSMEAKDRFLSLLTQGKISWFGDMLDIYEDLVKREKAEEVIILKDTQGLEISVEARRTNSRIVTVTYSVFLTIQYLCAAGLSMEYVYVGTAGDCLEAGSTKDLEKDFKIDVASFMFDKEANPPRLKFTLVKEANLINVDINGIEYPLPGDY